MAHLQFDLYAEGVVAEGAVKDRLELWLRLRGLNLCASFLCHGYFLYWVF